MDILLLIVGLGLLLAGANFLTDGSAAVAQRFRVPEFIIGLTIVAVGTSMPELVVSVLSAAAGNSDVAIGNVVGSNIFNVFVILGICALIRPLVLTKENIRRDIPFGMAASLVLLAVEICKELDVPVKHFKERLLPEHYPFIIVDAIYLKAREDHRVKSKALFVAIGINNTGHKEVLGFEVYDSEKVNTWRDFFENLKSRGLRGVDIVISDAHAGLVEAIKESFSGSSWQRCQAHFTR